MAVAIIANMTRKSDNLFTPKKMTIDELAIIVSNGFTNFAEEFNNKIDKLKEEIVTELKEEMDTRFAKVDERFEQIDKRFTQMDKSFDRLEPIISAHESRINRLEDKVFVSAQTT